jgi:hypothetical protein
VNKSQAANVALVSKIYEDPQQEFSNAAITCGRISSYPTAACYEENEVLIIPNMRNEEELDDQFKSSAIAPGLKDSKNVFDLLYHRNKICSFGLSSCVSELSCQVKEDKFKAKDLFYCEANKELLINNDDRPPLLSSCFYAIESTTDINTIVSKMIASADEVTKVLKQENEASPVIFVTGDYVVLNDDDPCCCPIVKSEHVICNASTKNDGETKSDVYYYSKEGRYQDSSNMNEEALLAYHQSSHAATSTADYETMHHNVIRGANTETSSMNVATDDTTAELDIVVSTVHEKKDHDAVAYENVILKNDDEIERVLPVSYAKAFTEYVKYFTGVNSETNKADVYYSYNDEEQDLPSRPSTMMNEELSYYQFIVADTVTDYYRYMYDDYYIMMLHYCFYHRHAVKEKVYYDESIAAVYHEGYLDADVEDAIKDVFVDQLHAAESINHYVYYDYYAADVISYAGNGRIRGASYKIGYGYKDVYDHIGGDPPRF